MRQRDPRRVAVTVALLVVVVSAFIWHVASGLAPLPGWIAMTSAFVVVGFQLAWHETDRRRRLSL